MAPKAFAVLIDPDVTSSGYYRPGAWIKGKVILTLREAQNIRGLTLTFKGYEQTCWNESYFGVSSCDYNRFIRHGKNNYRSSRWQQEDVYFKKSICLFGYPKGSYIPEDRIPQLPAGNSIYPFRLQIPADIPSAIELPHGKVCYEIAAFMDVKKSYFIFTPICPLSVKNESIINTHNLLQPLSVNQDKIIGLFSKQGVISCVSSISKQGYLPGETVLINSQITNESKKTTISVLEATLKAVTQYKASIKKIEVSYPVSEIQIKESIAPRSGPKIIQHRLTIPSNISLFSTRKTTRLINVMYEIEISVYCGIFGPRIKLAIPITIGNSMLDDSHGHLETAELLSKAHLSPSASLSRAQSVNLAYALEAPQYPDYIDLDLPPYREIVGKDEE